MRYHSLLPAALAVSTFWLAACGNDAPTEPASAARPTTSGPEMALAGSWITRANMPASRTWLAAATVTNGAGQSIVYAIGGQNVSSIPLTKVTAYNVATNTWTFGRPLPIPLTQTNGAGVINGKIYVSGGYYETRYNFPSNTLWMYDPATNAWTQKHPMPEIPPTEGGDRRYVGAGGVTGVINGKLYVVTACFTSFPGDPYSEGCPEHPAPYFFRYNPATDRWMTLPSPFADATPLTARSSPYSGGVIDGKFYVLSGHTFWEDDSKFSVYDPVTNRWTPKNALGLGRPGGATAVLGGKLFVIGGWRRNALGDPEMIDKTIVYDPATDRWTPVASLPAPRAGLAAAAVLLTGKPRIELVGGTVPDNNLQYVP